VREREREEGGRNREARVKEGRERSEIKRGVREISDKERICREKE
jgi:hypothetical protein